MSASMSRFRVCAVALVVALASIALSTGPASALGKPKSVGVSGHPGNTSMTLKWKWSKKPKRYRVQLSKTKSFTSGVRTKVVKRKKKKPHHGKQTTTFKHLSKATPYYYRMRAEKGKKHSAWTTVKKHWTNVPWPDHMSGLTITPGPGAGQATLTWSSPGSNTKWFKVSGNLTSTALKAGHGHNTKVFSAASARTSPGHYKYVVSAGYLKSWGASTASAQFVYSHLYAYNADFSHRRSYPGLQAIIPKGEAPNQAGTPLKGRAITVANYNILAAGDGEAWSSRKDRVAQNIVTSKADIVTLQEDSPSPTYDQIGELRTAVNAKGAIHYDYNRTGPFRTGSGRGTEGARILYNTGLFTDITNGTGCDSNDMAGEYGTESSCAFVPGTDDRWATYVHLQEINNPAVKFWVVSAHPNPLRTKAAEGVRTTEIKKIISTMDGLANGEPIILGMDSNTWQTYPMTYHVASTSHNALIAGGYYDTASSANIAARVTTKYPLSDTNGGRSNYRYSTDNSARKKDGKWIGYGHTTEAASAYGYAPRLDVIATKGMRGATDFFIQTKDATTSSHPPSDHNLILATIKLPAS